MYCAFSIPVHQSLNIQENEVEMSELLNQLWTPELQAAFTVVVVLLVIPVSYTHLTLPTTPYV